MTKIFRPTTWTKPDTHSETSSSGFTLIEVIVVVAIMALMGAMAMPSLSSYFQISLNSAARDLGTVIKEAYSSAAISGKIYRIVYDIDKNQYWVESGPPSTLLETEDSKKRDDRRRRFSGPEKGKKTSPFTMDTTITRKKKDLPLGVTYEDLNTQRTKELLSSGVEYTHIFPQGLTEQTIVHLKDTSNHHVTLVIPSLSGNLDVYDRYVSGDEVFEK